MKYSPRLWVYFRLQYFSFLLHIKSKSFVWHVFAFNYVNQFSFFVHSSFCHDPSHDFFLSMLPGDIVIRLHSVSLMHFNNDQLFKLFLEKIQCLFLYWYFNIWKKLISSLRRIPKHFYWLITSPFTLTHCSRFQIVLNPIENQHVKFHRIVGIF